ncbi:MAG: hypothetical protein LQ342_004110 [Letrouitia transgressa]|nr:MAG: hypothetical protein LQ342_004110 [Letrouitia transgressa]
MPGLITPYNNINLQARYDEARDLARGILNVSLQNWLQSNRQSINQWRHKDWDVAEEMERKAWERLGDWIGSLRDIEIELDGEALLLEMDGEGD